MSTTSTALDPGPGSALGPALETAELVSAARRLVPVLQARAEEAERARRVSEETMLEAEQFLDALVPRRWGGRGLGLRALCEVARELAHGDLSAAWVVSFMMQHNWMACRLATEEAQAALFAERPFVRAAAPLNPTGRAERVEGGFRVSGTFPYASGIWNADWTLLNAVVAEEGAPFIMMVRAADVTIADDWFMSGMASTGSSTFTVADLFVPDSMAISFGEFISADQHRGAGHDEPFMRYPLLAVVDHTSASVALGNAEACVAAVRDRLPSSRAMGQPRVDRPTSRVRWGEAAQKAKVARLLWEDSIDRAIAASESGTPIGPEDIGRIALDCMTVVQLAQEAVALVCDGMGSSTYRLADPLQRYRRDSDVIANHRAHDRDTIAEAATRSMLGIAAHDGDAFGGRAPVGALQ